MSDSVGKASLLAMAGSYLSIPLGILANVLLARMLSPEVKGSYTILMTTVGLALLPGPVIQTAIIHHLAHQRPRLSSLTRLINGAVVVQASLTFGLLALLGLSSSMRHWILGGLSPSYLWVILGMMASVLWGQYRAGLLSGLQRYSEMIVWTTASAFVAQFVMLGMLALWWSRSISPPIEWIVVANFSAMFLCAVGIWWPRTRRLQAPHENEIPFRQMVLAMGAFALPLFGRSVVEWANYRVDAYFINALIGPRELGVYTVAVGLAQQLWTVPFSVAAPIFARISSEGDTEASRELAQRGFRVTALVTLVMALSIALVAPPLLPLVYGSQYAGAVPLLFVLLPGVIAIGPTRVMSSYLAAIGQPSQILRAELVGLCATILLNASLLPLVGVMGAAIASTVAYAVYSLFLCRCFMRLSRSRWVDLCPSRQDWKYLQHRLPVLQKVAGLFRRTK